MLALGIQAFCEAFAESQLFFILYLASNHIFQEHIKTLKLYQNVTYIDFSLDQNCGKGSFLAFKGHSFRTKQKQ